MACTSCGVGQTFGMEHYTDAPNAPMQQLSTKKDSSCPAKKMMNNCLYTAQGMYVCDVDIQGESKTWGMSQNMDMMGESIRDNKVFRNTAPWETK